MSTQDIFYLSLSIGFIILISFVSLAAFQLSQALKSLKRVLDSAGNISEDVEAVKNQIKSGVLTAFLTGLNLFIKKKVR